MATATIQLKRDLTANWVANDPVLNDGEPGVEDTPAGLRLMKIGDGATPWNALPYASGNAWNERSISNSATAYHGDLIYTTATCNVSLNGQGGVTGQSIRVMNQNATGITTTINVTGNGTICWAGSNGAANSTSSVQLTEPLAYLEFMYVGSNTWLIVDGSYGAVPSPTLPINRPIKYVQNGSQSIPNSNSWNKLNVTTLNFDQSNGAYSTALGSIYAPIAGVYEIKASTTIQGASAGLYSAQIYQNSTGINCTSAPVSSAGVLSSAFVEDTVVAAAGDGFSIQVNCNSCGGGTAEPSPYVTSLLVNRIG